MPTMNVCSTDNDQVIMETITGNLTYVGFSRPGGATTDSVWKIMKLSYDGSNNLSNVQWAAGSPAYKHIWDDRASIVYS